MRDEVADGVGGGDVARLVQVRTQHRVLVLDAADDVGAAVWRRQAPANELCISRSWLQASALAKAGFFSCIHS